MTLSGTQIAAEITNGSITIEPFSSAQLNPNSYNYRLHPVIYQLEAAGRLLQAHFPSTGLLFEPNRVYLGATAEIIGSSKYVMTILGRSSMGRLGVYLNISADLGHVGSRSRWTLELTVVQPIFLYPNMLIGQVAFWETQAVRTGYVGRYHAHAIAAPNADTSLLFRERSREGES